MECQPQNTEFRNNPENFHPCIIHCKWLLFEIMFFQLLNFNMNQCFSLSIKDLYMEDKFQQPK